MGLISSWRVVVAGLGRLTGTVAKELIYSKVAKWFTGANGPLGVEGQLVSRPLNECLNVETWLSPANGAWVYVLAALPLGLRARPCRARA